LIDGALPHELGQQPMIVAVRNYFARYSTMQLVGVLALIPLALVADHFIPRLFSFDNVMQVLRQFAVQAIMAIGVTFVMISGRLDLSVGSLLSLCSVAAISLHDILGPGEAIAIALLIGVAVGCVNGFLVAGLGLNSLITTLGLLAALQGLSLIVTGGKNASIADPAGTWFAAIGRSHALGIPTPVLIVIALALVLGVVLHRTTFGRRIFAVGGNETASMYSSIRAPRVIFAAYVISGLMTAVAAVVLASRVMSARNDSGSGYELFVVAGVILGGTSLIGGSGGVLRSVVGIIILGFIQNATLLLGLPYYFQWLVTWAVIIVAVWIDVASKRGTVFA
jgi:ribose/xylose/arabinose/galactoside ABC-type transport system permease subunit